MLPELNSYMHYIVKMLINLANALNASNEK